MGPTGGTTLLLLVGCLIDGTGAPARYDVEVTIEAGRIVSVTEGREVGVLERSPSVLDLSRCTVLPGLIDTHAHLTMSPDVPAPDVPSELARRTDGELAERAVRHARLALSAGVTTIRDCGGPGEVTLRLARSVRGRSWTGPRLLVAGQPITKSGGHCHFMGAHVEGPDAMRATVRELCRRGADVIKVMVTGGMITPGSDPGVVQFSEEELLACVEEAHHLGRRVAGHVLCAAGVRAALLARIDTIEHCWTISGGAQDYEPELAVALAASSSFGSVTAHESLRELLPERRDDLVELRRRLVPHAGMRSAGVPLVVHSDAGTPGTRFEAFGESVAVFSVGLETGVPEAVRAATGTAAEALGLSDLVGSVAAGRRADLLVLEGDLSRDLSALRRVKRVFVGGEAVVEDGEVV